MNLIEKAYILLNTPLDPVQPCPDEIADVVNYLEAPAYEDVYYFKSPDEDRPEVILVSPANADGDIIYEKIQLGQETKLNFVGMNSNLETILLDEILNSKDVTALASKKNSIIKSMDNREAKNILDLCLATPGSQEVVKGTGKDILDTIIDMVQRISKYSTDYILLCASDVYDAIQKYDKENVTNFHFAFSIYQQIEDLGIKKVVKVLGKCNGTDILASGTAILVGRNSYLLKNRQHPLSLIRRKFSGEIAKMSGAEEGAVRLVSIVPVPIPINNNGKNTLGYSTFGYQSSIQVCIDFRAICWSTTILS